MYKYYARFGPIQIKIKLLLSSQGAKRNFTYLLEGQIHFARKLSVWMFNITILNVENLNVKNYYIVILILNVKNYFII